MNTKSGRFGRLIMQTTIVVGPLLITVPGTVSGQQTEMVGLTPAGRCARRTPCLLCERAAAPSRSPHPFANIRNRYNP